MYCRRPRGLPPVLGGKVPHKLRNRRSGVLDLAQKPNLTSPTGVRNRTALRNFEVSKAT
jgi:hypothetical protein